MKREITIGLAVVAGAAVLEAALIPGIILGGAALLAPRLLSNRRKTVRRKLPLIERPLALLREVSPSETEFSSESRQQFFGKSQLGRSIAKTITFRLIVTTLDFTTNYIVIGELTTAAGLSTFNLFAGPLFYFAHEAAWNYLGVSDTVVRINLPNLGPDDISTTLTISPAIAKTITYRTIATIVDFTTNYVVVGNLTEAMILTSAGFFLGPFVYYGHEKAWEYFSGDAATKPAPADTVALLPAPG